MQMWCKKTLFCKRFQLYGNSYNTDTVLLFGHWKLIVFCLNSVICTHVRFIINVCLMNVWCIFYKTTIMWKTVEIWNCLEWFLFKMRDLYLLLLYIKWIDCSISYVCNYYVIIIVFVIKYVLYLSYDMTVLS